MVLQLDANLETTLLKLKTQQQQQKMELSEFCACERDMAVRGQEKRGKCLKCLHKRHSELTWGVAGALVAPQGQDMTPPPLT